MTGIRNVFYGSNSYNEITMDNLMECRRNNLCLLKINKYKSNANVNIEIPG